MKLTAIQIICHFETEKMETTTQMESGLCHRVSTVALNKQTVRTEKRGTLESKTGLFHCNVKYVIYSITYLSLSF